MFGNVYIGNSWVGILVYRGVKLLIAPWGDPSNWKEVVYEFDKRMVRSSTSVKILQESVNPDKTIIIGLDTLAERGGSYQEVKVDAEEKIKGYADKFGLVNYEVLIAPGIGTFSNGIFYGDALDYYYYVIAKISLKLLENHEDALYIHLDLTHGINYSTILTYKAVKEIAEIFSVFKEVKFKAYNADPSIPKFANKLSINVIEDSLPMRILPAEKIVQRRLLEPINLSSEERSELFKNELRGVREIDDSEISAFIGALYNGLPLALFRFYPQRDKLKEIILKVLECYERYIDVERQDKLRVVRRVRIGRDFKVYVFAYVIAVLLKDLRLISFRKKEVTLEEVENVNNCLFKFDERFKNRIESDIFTFKEDLKGREIRDWRIYNEILGRNIGEPDERNFLAHSGFERNIVEVKKEGNKIMLRYRENRIRTIAGLCQRGLR